MGPHLDQWGKGEYGPSHLQRTERKGRGGDIFWAPFSVSSAILDIFIQFNSLKSPMIKLSALQVRKLAKGT